MGPPSGKHDRVAGKYDRVAAAVVLEDSFVSYRRIQVEPHAGRVNPDCREESSASALAAWFHADGRLGSEQVAGAEHRIRREYSAPVDPNRMTEA
jgi:hypothetical protein